MAVSDFLVGAVYFLLTFASSLGAAWILVARHFRHLWPLGRVLAFSLLATTAVVSAHVLPAAFGILDRPTALGASVLLLVAALFVSKPPAAEPEPRRPRPVSGRASVIVAAIAVGVAVVYELARLKIFATGQLEFIDVAGFHGPGVATWIQTGSLWRVDQFLAGYPTAQYPNNGDFLLLASALPWHDLAFARYTMVVFFGLTGLGSYALADELGASRAASATFAALVMTVPAISDYAFVALPDVVALATLAIGLVFLVRYDRTRLRSDLLLAGLGLGLSFGSKWFGLTAVAVVLAVWVVMWLLARRPAAEVAGDIAKLLVVITIAGGIWLVRNAVESGNPLYPKAVSLLGVHLFAGSKGDVVDTLGYTLASYLGDPHVLAKYIAPGFRAGIGIGGIAILLGIVVTAYAGARSLGRRTIEQLSGGIPLALVAVAVGNCVVYAITPGSAYGQRGLPIYGYGTMRWLTPAVVVGAPVAALAVRYLGRIGVVLELAALAGVVDGVFRGDPISATVIVQVLLVAAVILGAAWLVRRRRELLRARPALTGRWLALGFGGVCLCVLILLLRLTQESFDRHTYAPFDPVYAWVVNHAPMGHDIAIVGIPPPGGVAPILPMFGPHLGNRVTYVGDRARHSLELPANLAAFRQDLSRRRFDLLEVERGKAGPWDTWSRALGYRLLVQSRRLALYAAPARHI